MLLWPFRPSPGSARAVTRALLFGTLHRTVSRRVTHSRAIFILNRSINVCNNSCGIAGSLCSGCNRLHILSAPVTRGDFANVTMKTTVAKLQPVVRNVGVNFLLLTFGRVTGGTKVLHCASNNGFGVPVIVHNPKNINQRLKTRRSRQLRTCFRTIPNLGVITISAPCGTGKLLGSTVHSGGPILFFRRILLCGLGRSLPGRRCLIPLSGTRIIQSNGSIAVLACSQVHRRIVRTMGKLRTGNVSPRMVSLVSLGPLSFSAVKTSVHGARQMVVIRRYVGAKNINTRVVTSVGSHLFSRLSTPIIQLSSRSVPAPCGNGLRDLAVIRPGRVRTTIRRVINLGI